MINTRKIISQLSSFFQENLGECLLPGVLTVSVIINVDVTLQLFEGLLQWDAKCSINKAIQENEILNKKMSKLVEISGNHNSNGVTSTLDWNEARAEVIKIDNEIKENMELQVKNRKIIKDGCLLLKEQQLAVKNRRGFWENVLPFAAAGLATVLYVGWSCFRVFNAIKS